MQALLCLSGFGQVSVSHTALTSLPCQEQAIVLRFRGQVLPPINRPLLNTEEETQTPKQLLQACLHQYTW